MHDQHAIRKKKEKKEKKKSQLALNQTSLLYTRHSGRKRTSRCIE